VDEESGRRREVASGYRGRSKGGEMSATMNPHVAALYRARMERTLVDIRVQLDRAQMSVKTDRWMNAVAHLAAAELDIAGMVNDIAIELKGEEWTSGKETP